MAFQIANKNNVVSINTANPNLDGTGSISNLFTASGTYGSIVTSVRINSSGSVPQGMIRFFIKPSGGSWSLIKEIMVKDTPNNDPPFPVYNANIEFNLSLQNGYELGVSTETNTNFSISMYGYDIMGFI